MITLGTVNLTQKKGQELPSQHESRSCDLVKKQLPPRYRLCPYCESRFHYRSVSDRSVEMSSNSEV
jgi:hypothetical protein